MRIFTAFLVLVASAIMWLLPISTAVYDFKTDVTEDIFYNTSTAVSVSSANVTLRKEIYEDDTSSLSLSSNLYTDAPLLTSYNATNRQLLMSGLTANTTRTITVLYDYYALTGGGAIDTLVSRLDFVWMLALLAFPVAALAAIFTGHS